MYIQNTRLLDLLGDEELLFYIHNILREKKITPDSYAEIFCLLHSREAAPEDRVNCDAEGKTWYRGESKLTDAKLFGLLNDTCEIISLYVNSAWEDSLFSAWITDKPLKRAQKAMEDMESLASLRSILARCAESLRLDNDQQEDNEHMDWEDTPEENTPDATDDFDPEE